MEQNATDVARHARDFADRTGFTYTVLERRQVAAALAREVPEAGSLTWTTRSARANPAFE